MADKRSLPLPGDEFQVAVGQHDIDSGIREDSGYCPVAQAIRRRTGGAYVDVTYTRVRIGDSQYFQLPDKVIEWIDAYDGGVKSYPFRFPLVIPER